MQPKPLRRSIRVVTSQLASPAPVFGCVCETDSAGPAPSNESNVDNSLIRDGEYSRMIEWLRLTCHAVTQSSRLRRTGTQRTQRNSTAMSAIDLLGYSAALAVLAAFCMSSIVSLRIVAVLSNMLFASYGLLAHLYPLFVLHSILLPINLLKLAQFDLPLRNKNSSIGSVLWSWAPFRKERV